MKRRDALMTLSAGAVGLSAVLHAQSSEPMPVQSPFGAPPVPETIIPPQPVTAVVIGAGNRGNVYAGYAAAHPDQYKIVGVAEPIPYRNQRMSEAHAIPEEHRFESWEQVFEIPKFADSVIISTPDHLHYGPAIKALELGYEVLLEKVVAQTWEECNDILALATKNQRIVAVCHVLRYSPYFRQLKHILDSGFIGKVVSVQHLEPVEHIHMSHSFVRGNWSNSKVSNPMILSKSCHDTDILRWLVGKPCERVSSMGSLTYFRKENAPAGATLRCTDGCPVEEQCAFSALRLYYRNKGPWLSALKIENFEDPTILEALRTGPYGRCVYHCDNDVVDHQVSLFEFEDGITAAFSMEGLTSYGGRRTRIMGTNGDIVGDEQVLDVYQFDSQKRFTWNVADHADISSGHGGGDWGLVHDFVQAVSRKDPSLLTSTLEASMESHLMGFKAEESRLTGKTLSDLSSYRV